MSTRHTIRFTRGDSYFAKARWKDSEGTVVTVVSARMQIRPSTAGAVLLELDDEDGLELDYEDEGYIAITITPEQSAQLRTGVYDLEATSDSGQVKTIASGSLIVDKDITR